MRCHDGNINGIYGSLLPSLSYLLAVASLALCKLSRKIFQDYFFSHLKNININPRTNRRRVLIHAHSWTLL